jgi:hypothetical protein
VWVSLVGARPKGPRPDLQDGPQKILLTRLHELNNPYRVSYDMVARQLWSGQGPTNVQRSRTRDLSRQFRGEKAIEWQVVEIYVGLLLTEAEPAQTTELGLLRELHTQAFSTAVAAEGAPPPAPRTAPIDPDYVAELERQLDEARTRASFATALLVIVQAENTALRGRGSSFDWFNRPDTDGTTDQADKASARPRGGKRAATEPATGGRTAGTRSDTDTLRPADPATTPIVRREGYRTGQRRRPASNRSTLTDAFPAAGRTPAYTAAAPPAPPAAPAALTRSRPASSSLRRATTPEPASDDAGLDILVSGGEKRRRGKKS